MSLAQNTLRYKHYWQLLSTRTSRQESVLIALLAHSPALIFRLE